MSAFDANGLICNIFTSVRDAIKSGMVKICFLYYQLSFTEVEAYEELRNLCQKHKVILIDTLTGREQGSLVGKNMCV